MEETNLNDFNTGKNLAVTLYGTTLETTKRST